MKIKGQSKKGRNAGYKNLAIHIMPTDFLIIELYSLSVCSPIENGCMPLRIAGFTCFTVFPKRGTKGGLNCICPFPLFLVPLSPYAGYANFNRSQTREICKS